MRICCKCGSRAFGVQLICIIDASSGPGSSVYACDDCIERYGLKPLDLDHDLDPGPPTAPGTDDPTPEGTRP